MKAWKIFIVIISVGTSFLSCSRDPALYHVSNLNGDTISAFGHGGMGPGFKYPIDTWESFEPLLRIGGEGTDLDVQMTSDSVIVLYHHQKLEDGTGCTGTINDKLWSEIWGCHFASPFSYQLNLMSGDQFFGSKVSNPQQYIFTFDCKLYSNAPDHEAYRKQYANALIKLIDDHHLMNTTLIESQDTTFIRILQQKRSGLKIFIYPHNFQDGLNIATAMGLYGITIANGDITAEQVKIAHQNGLQITLWNCETEKENLDAIQKNPDHIQSDKIIYLLKIFGKYKG